MPNHHNLRQFVDRADLILQNDLPYLSGYWNEELGGFHANQVSKTSGRINVTTTCTCVFAALRNPAILSRSHIDKACKIDGGMVLRVAKALLGIPWISEDLLVNNLYSAPIAIRTLYRLLETPADKDAVKALLNETVNIEKLTKAFKDVLDATKEGVAHLEPYEASAFLTYWSFRALRSEEEHKLLDQNLTNECAIRATALGQWAEREVYRQIAYHAAQDAASFDATQLAYSVRIYAQDSGILKKPLNRKLLAKAIEVIATSQMPDGLWPKAHPIFHYKTRGNVYTFTFEMLDVILSRWLPAELFKPYLEKLEASLRWAEQNLIDGTTTSGWRSNHIPFGSEAEGWSTAAVLNAVSKMRRIASYHLNEAILEEFRAKRFVRPDNSPLAEDKFYDCEVPWAQPLSLKDTLKKYLILPHLPSGLKKERCYSAVFFGPPGTAKTTLAEAIAQCLGWPYIYLQTSDFAGEMNQVIGKARDVFSRLTLLEQAVILFDEVEEFVRDRRDPENSPQTRMLTTSMLSLIQELRSQKKVIFIVATNFLDKFDAAITRPGGRFDLMILVAPPSRTEKARMFYDQLLDNEAVKHKKDQLGKVFEEFLKNHYQTEIQFFAFSEWRTFIDETLHQAESTDITISVLQEMLKRHEQGIAIRESLRTAYVNSQKFVRIC